MGGKVRDLLRDPWQRGPITDEGNAVVLYALSTLALAKWLEASGVAAAWIRREPPQRCRLAVGLELLQALVSSRTPSGWDARGPPARRRAGDGAGAGRAHGPAPAVRGWGCSSSPALSSAAISSLGPFEIAEEPPGFHLVPVPRLLRQQLVSGREPRDRDDADLLSVWIRARTGAGGPAGRAGGAALVVVAAAGTEYAQSWFVGRYPDVTDMAFHALGGVLGVLVQPPGRRALRGSPGTRAVTAP